MSLKHFKEISVKELEELVSKYGEHNQHIYLLNKFLKALSKKYKIIEK